MIEQPSLFRQLEPGSRRERAVLGVSLAAAGFILLLDQATKVMVERSFQLHESRILIENFFSLMDEFIRNIDQKLRMIVREGQ